MLKEYYKFLCNRLIDWSRNIAIQAGDRYVLNFENDNQVREFMTILAGFDDIYNFQLMDEQYGPSALVFDINENSHMRLVVVSTVEVTPDYLVSLRNRIGQQQGIWQNTALLFVSNKILDSINSGAKDIGRQGGPFNTGALKRNMQVTIDNSQRLSKDDKDVLKFMVKTIYDGEQELTLMDFAGVYGIIEKGELSDSDYIQMGYFQDRDLPTYTSTEKEDRLAENHVDYVNISLAHGFGDVRTRVAKIVYGEQLVSDLSGNNWQSVNYKRVLAGKDRLEQNKKISLAFDAEKMQLVNEDMLIWDRPKGNSKAGQRTRYIIVFNEKQHSKLTISFPFDAAVQEKWISQASINHKCYTIKTYKNQLVVEFSGLKPNVPESVKVRYRHHDIGSLGFTFNILIVPFGGDEILSLRPYYRIKVKGENKANIEIPSDIGELVLGSGNQFEKLDVDEISQLDNLRINSGDQLKADLSHLSLDDDENFTVALSDVPLNFNVFDNDDNKIQPKSALDIERYRREHADDGHYRNQRIIFGSEINSVFNSQKKYFDLEASQISTETLIEGNFEVSEQLTEKYQHLFSVLRKRMTLMSLIKWDQEVVQSVHAILSQIEEEVVRTENGVELSAKVRNISRIGEHWNNHELSYSPLNPMLLSYQLQVETDVQNEKISRTLERKLSPVHLVPFLKRDSLSYRAFFSENAPRWLHYSEANMAKFGQISQTIITERLKDFKKHFSYLFDVNPRSSYNIKFVNITDEKPLIKSLVDYLYSEIEQVIKRRQPINEINPINVYMECASHDAVNSDFNEFYQLDNRDEFTEFFNEPLKKNKDISDEEILEFMKEKINVFYDFESYQGFHITFYQFVNKLTLDGADRENLEMNYSLNGVIGGTEYTSIQESLKDGFGTKGIDNDDSAQVVHFAESWNELLVATSQQHIAMTHGMTLTNSIEEVDSHDFQSQFDSSNWVTVLNPEVKLDYFNKLSQDIYVIHYTDYTNSVNYESITLTKQVDQYRTILSENLPQNIKQRNSSSYTDNIIKTFNIINGEWLLRLVSHRQQQKTVKEKLSILAVSKEMLGVLQRDDIIWVPLSLEEILRVSGSFVGESRSDMIFSAKSLGTKGKISDDLLFIGLKKDGEHYDVMFLPTEVKVGLNSNAVIDKAIEQVQHTASVLDETLVKQRNFKSKFYLDFFMKLYFANAAKLYTNGEMDTASFGELVRAKRRIIQGNIEVSTSMLDCYRNKFIFSLKTGHTNRQIRIMDDYTSVEVPEDDAFSFAGQETKGIIDEIQNNRFGFDKNRLLKNEGRVDDAVTEVLKNEKINVDIKTISNSQNRNPEVEEVAEEKAPVYRRNNTGIRNDTDTFRLETNRQQIEAAEKDESRISTKDEDNSEKLCDESEGKINTQNMKGENDLSRRIRIGTIDGSTSKVYWEYGSDKLANRHMLITGKSGQGKTYFIQTLLLEFTKAKIDTVVIDYTDSYMPDQLDATFKDNIKQINQHIVLADGLPINPFSPQRFDIGEYHQLEGASGIAQRVAEVLDFVFGLGIQQKSRLVTVMTSGLEGNSNYTFAALKETLLDSGESIDTKLYGRLQALLMRDPFTYKENFDWSNYFGRTGKINIVQLSGYPASLQNVMIEFLLWDLINYAKLNSNRGLIYPIFLDEVQNLNFDKDSPTVKILREGRKFGFSGLFATQSLSSIKGEVDAIYNAAEQVHFLPPESQTKAIAKILSSDRAEQNKFEQELTTLSKGQCVISGPSLVENGDLVKQVNVVDIDNLTSRLS
ncbi:helicase HerA domain-containing protein [Lactiplantibacillus paraplantarum]|uniref:helicase HerA domain-containing protein n=1 Tax=Lactiplantibacillus paraplantarum TaxID=60520 RepID=UPI003DA2BC0C